MEVLKKSIPSKYISYFARHNTAANLIFVLMIVLGLFAVNNIRSQFFPDVPIEKINIGVKWVGAGPEEIDDGNTATDAEYSAIVATYTAGGMTLTGKLEEAENTNGTTNSSADFEYWTVSAAFAF